MANALSVNTLNNHGIVFYKFHIQVKYFTSCDVLAVVLNRFNEVLAPVPVSSNKGTDARLDPDPQL